MLYVGHLECKAPMPEDVLQRGAYMRFFRAPKAVCLSASEVQKGIASIHSWGGRLKHHQEHAVNVTKALAKKVKVEANVLFCAPNSAFGQWQNRILHSLGQIDKLRFEGQMEVVGFYLQTGFTFKDE